MLFCVKLYICNTYWNKYTCSLNQVLRYGYKTYLKLYNFQEFQTGFQKLMLLYEPKYFIPYYGVSMSITPSMLIGGTGFGSLSHFLQHREPSQVLSLHHLLEVCIQLTSALEHMVRRNLQYLVTFECNNCKIGFLYFWMDLVCLLFLVPNEASKQTSIQPGINQSVGWSINQSIYIILTWNLNGRSRISVNVSSQNGVLKLCRMIFNDT